MGDSNIDPSERRAVIAILAESGPMTHEELTNETGYDWRKTREIIRDLRNSDEVYITLDRRYEVEDSDNAAVV